MSTSTEAGTLLDYAEDLGVDRMGIPVLFRDAHVLVLNKPAGLAVHCGPGGHPSVEDQLDELRFGFVRQPGLAHRLDADTAGCLILGRHPKALVKLGRMFAARQVEKIYWAVVAGDPAADSGVIDLPLARASNRQNGWRVRIDKRTGQPAVTLWRVLARAKRGNQALAWIEFKPQTGRTHQLRVHAAASGWPVLDDPIYAEAARRNNPTVGLALLARRLILPYASDRPPIDVSAPTPAHMRSLLALFGTPPPDDENSTHTNPYQKPIRPTDGHKHQA